MYLKLKKLCWNLNEERYSWNNYKYKQHQNINLHMYHWNFLKACTEVILNLLEILKIGSCTEKKQYINGNTIQAVL